MRIQGEIQSSRSKFTDLIIFKNRWWQHLLFWLVALLILFNIFKGSGVIEKIDIIYTLIFIVPIAAVVYLNLYIAVPRLLRKERYLLYTLFFLFLPGGGALFLYFLFDSWIDLILPDFYFISYYSVPVLMLYCAVFIIFTTLLKLSRSWFMLLRAERMTSTHQLKSLQSQINPHFLLNSLQTIYALSLEKSDDTPDVILQLSDILKYNLYETAQSSIELEKELTMIRDYTEMYRHRVDSDHRDIRMEEKGDPEGLLIAPMLLIPFIENSFKHGLSGDRKKSYIHIRTEIKGNKLLFMIRNSRFESEKTIPGEQKGIGIENTRQRLELLYPGRYVLEIENPEDTFCVKLSIELNRK